MDKYKIVLQIFAILFILYLGYLLIKLIGALCKRNRLVEFSLDIKDNNDEKSWLFKLIYSFADFLKSLVIFNGVAKTYDKYIYEDSRLKKGMDYVAIKILLGIGIILLYLFMTILYQDIFNSLVLLVCFVVGFIIPDFYCLFIRRKRTGILNKNILNAIIIMNNSYKANGSTEQAILDVIERTDGKVSFEFKKVLNDINMGIDISNAFLRMYKRVKSEAILYISRVLELVNKSGINIVDAFNVIEAKLIEEEKFNNEINSLKGVNKFALIIFMLLPLVFVISLILYNKLYVEVFIGYIGSFVLSILLIMYLFYLIIIHRIYRGGRNDK